MTFSRTVLITGGTMGLGYGAALEIARQHPEYLVIIASRSDKTSAAELINKTLHQKNVQYLPLDLSSLAKVRSFAQEWGTKNFGPIQALLLNAALQWPDSLVKTDDGIRGNLWHLSYDARIIITSSGTHDPAQKSGLPDAIYNTAEELAHPTPKTEKYPGRQRYASSKLANVLFAYALHRKFQSLPQNKLAVVAFDPGLMPGTGLAREASPVLRWLWIYLMPRMLPLVRFLVGSNVHTAQESGANLAWLALSLDVAGTSGKYYEGKKEIKSSKHSYDEKKQDDLWEWTVKNTSTSEEERKKFETLH